MKAQTIPIATAEEFRQQYKKNLWNFTFFDRNIRTILEQATPEQGVILAYIDTDGYLLKRYGQAESLKNFEALGVVEGSIWTEEATGSNAITNGLFRKETQSSAGCVHTLSPLQTMSIYFSPIQVYRNTAEQAADTSPNLGGVAIFSSIEASHPNHLLTVAGIAHDVMMTLHFNQTSTRSYNRNGAGLIIVDYYMKPGEVTITYTADATFHVLGIEPEDIRFQPLQTFLPFEDNASFWEMIQKKTPVFERTLTLKLCNKSLTCIVSSEEYHQPGLKVGGLIIYITTPRVEACKISRKIANTALLSFSDIVGESPAAQSTIRRAARIAETDSNVMILGESGVGKDVFAQAIHNASTRMDMPFIAVNCGALPRELIASELFGYDSGAFTGAKKNGNIGKFELADGGTIFLDEIGELPLDLQSTLLRAVEQKQFMRLGSNKLINIDVKIISATNADIPRMIEQKLFRSDLFYRLSTLKLSLPPLRERGRDILLLSNHFIRAVSRRAGKGHEMVLSEEAAALLLSLPWHGNIRELQNLIECIVQLYDEKIIMPEHILENINFPISNITPPETPPAPLPRRSRKRSPLTAEEIQEAFQRCNGNRSEAADYLGIARKTLYRNMERLGII